MMTIQDKFEAAKCYWKTACLKADPPGKPLFEREWDVFVIKLDQETGEHFTQTICCDAAPVRQTAAQEAAANC